MIKITFEFQFSIDAFDHFKRWIKYKLLASNPTHGTPIIYGFKYSEKRGE